MRTSAFHCPRRSKSKHPESRVKEEEKKERMKGKKKRESEVEPEGKIHIPFPTRKGDEEIQLEQIKDAELTA